MKYFCNNKVSVIIPTYNYGHFIGDCIQSVLSQTWPNLQIIVVDDGSSDNTLSIVKKFQGKVEYIYQKNKGLSAARNTGLRHAAGEFIQFLDADDLLAPIAIEGKIKLLMSNPSLFIAVSPNRMFSSLNNDKKVKIDGQWLLHRKNLNLHLIYSNIAPPHAFLLHRDIAHQVGYFDESLKACEDYDYWLRAAKLGYQLQYCSEGLAYYRRHSTSMSANRFNQYYHDVLLHLRVFSLFFADQQKPISSSHWLAFWAGVLTTIGRLELRQHPVIDELSSLFVESIDKGIATLSAHHGTLDSIALGYWMIIQRRLAELSTLNEPKIFTLLNIARHLEFSSVFGSPSPVKDIIRIMSGWRRDPVDFFSVASSLVRYVRGRRKLF